MLGKCCDNILARFLYNIFQAIQMAGKNHIYITFFGSLNGEIKGLKHKNWLLHQHDSKTVIQSCSKK